MKDGKSHGNDGLTKEFYMCFFNEICNQLIAALTQLAPGGGVFSTSSPVNGSELQNRTSYHLETW